MKICSIDSLEKVKALLATCKLPIADLTPLSSPLFFGVCVDNELMAIVGIEMFDGVGLLRSLAVSPTHQGKGLARELVCFAEGYAKERNIKSIFLLTETAEDFFRKLGYQMTDRSKAPESIRSTSQYSGLCPASSALMSRHLQ